MRKKRYEMLLPLKYNDGRPVPDELLKLSGQELVDQFDALSFQPNAIRGIWTHEGSRYEDELVRYVIDVDDTPENHQFFLNFKTILLERFQQVEIYIASYPVEIL